MPNDNENSDNLNESDIFPVKNNDSHITYGCSFKDYTTSTYDYSSFYDESYSTPHNDTNDNDSYDNTYTRLNNSDVGDTTYYLDEFLQSAVNRYNLSKNKNTPKNKRYRINLPVFLIILFAFLSFTVMGIGAYKGNSTGNILITAGSCVFVLDLILAVMSNLFFRRKLSLFISNSEYCDLNTRNINDYLNSVNKTSFKEKNPIV